jgi:hypothetical protein
VIAFLSLWWVPVAAVVLLLAAWDVVFLVRGGVKATISAHVIGIAYRTPLAVWFFGLAIGVVAGHLLWGQALPGCVCP